MADGTYVSLERNGPTHAVTIRRADLHNAFNEHVIQQIAAAFAEIERGDARVVVLAGEGRSFSAGADLDWMRRAASFSEEENLEDAIALAGMLRAVATCSRPVIARVQGAAFGGGAGLVAAADIAIAGASARFGFTEVRLGLVPATIARHVVRKIGVGHATALFLTGEPIDAARAFDVGLIHRVVPEERLDDAVRETIDALLRGGPRAQRQAKAMLSSMAGDTDEVDARMAELIARIRTTDETREGVTAFLEKRPPRWLAGGDV